MHRRRYLAGFVAALAGSAAGCAASGGDTPTPTPMSYDTYHLRHDEPVVEGGVPLQDAPPDEQRTVHLITAADGTDRFDRAVLDEEAATFVENTDFSEAHLLAIGTYLGSTSATVDVAAVEQADDRATARVRIEYPTVGDTAIAYETVLVRVHREGQPAPDAATVTFDIDGSEETVTAEG